MADPRIAKLAQVIVQYSMRIKKDDKVVINSTPHAAPLIQELVREIVQVGAYPSVRTPVEGIAEIFMREASQEQLQHVSELGKFEMEYFNKYLSIMAAGNTKAMSGIDPKRMALNQQANAPLMQRLMERSAKGDLDWCITLFPTNAYAQDAGMSLEDYSEFVFNAGLLNEVDPVATWQQVQDEQQRIADYLGQRNEIHIVAPGTDITYRVDGRLWINACGNKNFPDGEVFTGPLEDSANGHVSFTYPAVYMGNEVEGVRLVFENGKCVEATAERGQDFLTTMLDQDAGARFLGEVAFGLNYGIQRFSRTILFDEKIGGTMHMALGRSIAESGGKNNSALHWDMVCDLREGKVYADGELCYEGGKFIF